MTFKGRLGDTEGSLHLRHVTEMGPRLRFLRRQLYANTRGLILANS